MGRCDIPLSLPPGSHLSNHGIKGGHSGNCWGCLWSCVPRKEQDGYRPSLSIAPKQHEMQTPIRAVFRKMRTAALTQVFTQLLCFGMCCVSASPCPTLGAWIHSSFYMTGGPRQPRTSQSRSSVCHRLPQGHWVRENGFKQKEWL